MTYELFKETLITELQGHFPPDTTINIHSILRNNQVYVDGLTILESGFNIAPTIYVEDYYSNLKKGVTFSIILKQILETYYQCRPIENINPSFFCDFENIKQHIVYKLIHYEKNHELLSQIPHVPFLDLAIVFYCLVASDSSGTATILIRNEHLALWNTTQNDIYEIAKKNTPLLLSYQFETMSSLLTDLLSSNPAENDDLPDLAPFPIYVLTNHCRFLGAACLLYDNLMMKLSEDANADFFIIPSSVHEVLLIPSTSDIEHEEFNQMIQEVNSSQLIPEEILSDHVYFYSRETNEISYPTSNANTLLT